MMLIQLLQVSQEIGLNMDLSLGVGQRIMAFLITQIFRPQGDFFFGYVSFFYQ
jgi:hypothetical protein